MMPFFDRNPTPDEAAVLALMLSTFSDGTGTQREVDGSSRAGWKEIERVFSEFFTGQKHSEDKDVFDLIVEDWQNKGSFYGASIKSKQLTGKKTPFHGNIDARAYLEISNSPARMWASITAKSRLLPSDFEARKFPQRMGDALIATITDWKLARKRTFELINANSSVDLAKSYYITLSLSPYSGVARQIHIASFPMQFPDVKWRYASGRCLRADDPAFPGEPLLDWYPFSGGQLKYYPRFSTAHFSSEILTTQPAVEVSILKKASAYFEDEMNEHLSRLDPEQIALIEHLIAVD